MEKNKYPHTDPNGQVHSEYEHSVGNSFDVVRKETPTKNKNEADKFDPLNQLPENEYDVLNEWDMEKEPPKMSAGGKGKVDKTVALIGLLGIIGVIGIIGIIKSLRVDKLTD
jgi:hypothetical protein